jgi:hypothetical protein
MITYLLQLWSNLFVITAIITKSKFASEEDQGFSTFCSWQSKKTVQTQLLVVSEHSNNMCHYVPFETNEIKRFWSENTIFLIIFTVQSKFGLKTSDLKKMAHMGHSG